MSRCSEIVEFFEVFRGVTLDQMTEFGPRGGRRVFWRARCLRGNQVALWHRSRSSAAKAGWPDKAYRLAVMLESTGEFEIVDEFTAASKSDAEMFAESKLPLAPWYVLDDQGRNIFGGRS